MDNVNLFKKGFDGKTIFFPKSWRGKGYILESEEQEQNIDLLLKKMTKNLRYLWLILPFFVPGVFFALMAMNPDTPYKRALTAAFLSLILLLSSYFIAKIPNFANRRKMKNILKTLTLSENRMTRNEVLQKNCK
jgi:hypothetical protein